jgi:hypothetical protein
LSHGDRAAVLHGGDPKVRRTKYETPDGWFALDQALAEIDGATAAALSTEPRRSEARPREAA